MDWGKLLEVFLVAVIPFIVPPAVAWLIAVARNAWADFADRKPDLAYYLEQAAVFAVRAAEGAGAGKIIKDKKTYALEVAQSWLKLKGINIDLALIDAAVEKAVLDEFNEQKTDYLPEPE